MKNLKKAFFVQKLLEKECFESFSEVSFDKKIFQI